MSQPPIRIVGIPQIGLGISRLPVHLQRAAESAVLRAGAKPLVKAARARAPIATGLLKKSIGFRVKKVRGIISARVGPRTGYAKEVTRMGRDGRPRQVFSDPNKYSHLVELGTSRTAAKPFIRPAMESVQTEVLQEMAEGYTRHLERVIARLRAR